MSHETSAEPELSAPRYTSRIFPPYRFLPGRDPHPTANPKGHSYLPPGHHEPPVMWRPPEEWRACHEYLYGCDLYNHGYWWEAHEAWEGLWKVCPKDSVQKRFLQGLIQVSACQLKLRLGSREGVERLRESYHGHFDFVLSRLEGLIFMGLNVRGHLRAIDGYFDVCTNVSAPPGHQYAAFPYVRLFE